jgi:hypothetical protein
MSTRNPNASSTSVGTYLSSLFRRTHSFSSGDFRYSPGEMFNSFTICSNEFGNATGRIDPGFVKLRFTERRIITSACLISVLPRSRRSAQPKNACTSHILLNLPPALPNKLFSHGTGDFGRRYRVNLGNPWVCRASVGGGGAETYGVRTYSGIDPRPLSGFGHRSFVDR